HAAGHAYRFVAGRKRVATVDEDRRRPVEPDAFRSLGRIDELVLELDVIPGDTAQNLTDACINCLPMRTTLEVLDRDLHARTLGTTRSFRTRPISKASWTGSRVVPSCSAIHWLPVSFEAKNKTRWQKLSITS